MLYIDFIQLTDTAMLPEAFHKGDVGFDLYSDEDVVLEAGSVCKVKTGLELSNVTEIIRRIKTDSPPCSLKIEGRSSLAAKGIFPIGRVIEPSYRGEIIVELAAVAKPNWKNENGEATNFYNIKKRDRIAQLVIYRAYVWDSLAGDNGVVIQPTNMLLSSTGRDSKGFGSTGR